MANVGPNGVLALYSNDGNFQQNFGTPGNSSSMRWDSSNPPINMEMTGYFFKSSPSSDTTSMKIRGGRHTDSAPNDGCCYILQPPCEGGTFQYQIECPHPNNHDCNPDFAGSCLGIGAWRGYKAIVWNTAANCVHWECWEDKGNNSSAPANQWVRVGYATDCNGDCGNIGSQLLRPKGSTSQATFRIDENSGTQGKWLHIVQLVAGNSAPAPPTGGGTTPPGTTPGTGGSGPGTPGTGGSGPGTTPGGNGTPPTGGGTPGTGTGGGNGGPVFQGPSGGGMGDGGGGAGNDFNTGTASAFAQGGCAIAIAGNTRAQAGNCGGVGEGISNPGDGGSGGATEGKPIITVYKDLSLLYNIRTDLFDNCTISGDPNIANYEEIYSVSPVEGEYLTVFQNSITMFVGVKLHASSSALYKKVIRKVSVTMKRSTAVALTGNVVMQIRDRNGNLMTEFDTSIDPATIPLNDTTLDFIHNENSYKLEAGDMIVLAYADGGDTTNHILVGHSPGVDSFDGFNTVFVESASGLSYDVDQLADAAFKIFT
jgi:hypothetical protein